MPTKTSPDSVVVKTQTSSIQQNGLPGAVQDTTYSTAKWTNSVTYGDNIPGWRDNLRRGLDATTSMVGSESFAHLVDGRLDCSRPLNMAFPTQIRSVSVVGAMLVDPALPAGNPASVSTIGADAKALAKFNERVRQLHNAFQGGVVLGELAQTLRMIKNPLRGLRRQTDDVLQKARIIRAEVGRQRRRTVHQVGAAVGRRLSHQDAMRLKERLSDLWLETQYGWRPLLHDIRDGFTALHRYNIGQTGIANRAVSAVGMTEESSLSSTTNNLSLAVWKNAEVSVTRATVKYRGAIRVEPRNPAEMDPELLGFDLASFAPTAWELVPYSFLIDYFSNAGEVIEGWSSIGTRLAWCNRTARTELERTVSSWTSKTLIKKTTPDIESVSFTPMRFICRKKYVSRAKYTGTLVPALVFEIPGSGSLKWLNIAALIGARSADRTWSYD